MVSLKKRLIATFQSNFNSNKYFPIPWPSCNMTHINYILPNEKNCMKCWWNGEIIMYDRTIIENKTEAQETHFGWKLITECNIDNFWSGQLIIMLEPQQITAAQIQRTYHRRHHSQTFMNFSIFSCVLCIACLIGFISLHISHTFLRSSCDLYCRDRGSVAHTGKKSQWQRCGR